MNIAALCGVALTLASCPLASAQTAPTIPSAPQPAPRRTVANFTGLPKGITLTELERKVGQADGIEGSGVAYYIYHLADGSRVIVLCNDTVTIPFIDHIKDGVKTRLYDAKK